VYAGPLRDEPLAIELHNTVYMSDGVAYDGLADPGWLDALVHRLPEGGAGSGPTRDELPALRDAVRAALHAALDARPHDARVLATINRACARAPRSAIAVWHRDADPTPAIDFHGMDRAGS